MTEATAKRTAAVSIPGIATPLAPVALVGVLMIGMLAWQGVPILDSVAYLAYFLLVIVLPGRLIWRRLMRADAVAVPARATRLEEWVGGAAAGYVLEIVTYPVARWAGQPLLYLVAPAAVLVVLGLASRRDAAERRALPVSASVRWALAGVIAYFTVWLSVILFTRYRLTPYRIIDADEQFHLALIGELRNHFPPVYPQMDAGRLAYQWFVHAHMAASSWVTGIDPLVIYRRFDVLVLSVLCILGTAMLAMRLSGRPWVGPVAAGIVVLVGSFDITGVVDGQAAPEERFMEAGLLMNSPTQTLAFALAMPVALLCLHWLRHPSKKLWAALALGLLVLVGVKVTFPPMFMCGFLGVVVIDLIRRRGLNRAALGGALTCLGVIVGSGLILYAGDSQSLRFQPGDTSTQLMRNLGLEESTGFGALVVTLALLCSWCLSGIGAIGLLRDRELRWDARVWWLFGTVVSGLGATFLLTHGGMSQLYFGRSAAPLVAVLSAWGLSRLIPEGSTRRQRLAVAVAAVAGGLLLLVVRLFTETLRVREVIHGKSQETPLLRTWVNLPAVLILIVVLVGVGMMLRDLTKGRRRLPAAVGVAFLLGLGLARPFAFIGGHFPDVKVDTMGQALPPGGMDTALWLRAHSSPDQRVMTNVHCLKKGKRVEGGCDSRHFWLSGFSERRFVLEGWAYTRFGDGWNGGFWGDKNFLKRNDGLFVDPTAQGLTSFARAHDVGWMVVDTRERNNLDALDASPLLQRRFSEGQFVVYEVSSAD